MVRAASPRRALYADHERRRPAPPGWQSLVAYRVRRAHADPCAGNAVPPIVVREYRQDDVTSWKRTEAELASLPGLMSQIGLTQAGFRLAAPREASVNDRATIP